MLLIQIYTLKSTTFTMIMVQIVTGDNNGDLGMKIQLDHELSGKLMANIKME